MRVPIVHVDMDDVLCNYLGAYREAKDKNPGILYPQSIKGFYLDLKPIPGAIEGFKFLQKHFEVYIATRPSYMNVHCYSEKREWVEKYLGLETCKNLAMTPNKNLLMGDFLIDDVPWIEFKGEQILFGSDKFPGWDSVLKYLSEKHEL
jgi:5'(3')-deoxyribonucleotidase